MHLGGGAGIWGPCEGVYVWNVSVGGCLGGLLSVCGVYV